MSQTLKASNTKINQIKGQTSLDRFVQTPPKELEDPKQRTPPSVGETNPTKKLNMEEEMEEDITNRLKQPRGLPGEGVTPTPMPGEGVTPTPTPAVPPVLPRQEGPKDVLDIKLEQMEERITASLTASMAKLIADALKPLQESMRKLTEKTQKVENSLQETTDLRSVNIGLNKRLCSVETENIRLKERLESIENRILEQNVLITGIPEEAWELESNLTEKIIKLISCTIDSNDEDDKVMKARGVRLAKVRRIGLYTGERGRPVSVEFDRKSDAKYFLQSKKKLPEGVYASREYTFETEQDRRFLRPILRAAKQNPNYRCRMEGSKIIINGKRYSRNDIHNLPDDLSGYNVSSKTDDHTVGFFGELNPFSNFHKCSFTYNEVEYHCSEQFIQHQKAIHCNDTSAAKMILQASSAWECKRLSRSIREPSEDTPKWTVSAKKVCLPGIKAKFNQNPALKTLLLNTGKRTLVECSYDKLWSTGIPLHDNNCLDPNKWTSKGILGEILMTVREDLASVGTIPSSNRSSE